MGVDFVRDNREHPFPVDHEALLSLIQDELWLGVIRLPSENPPQDFSKKYIQGACQASTTLTNVSEVPCVVCHDKNLHVLFEDCIFGNIRT